MTFVGLAVESSSGAGELLLDRLDWSGQPTVSFSRPARGGVMWQRAWVDAVTRVAHGDEPFRLIQDAGLGLLIQGTRDWRDYRVSADVTPHLAEAAGLGARVQGIERGYVLELIGRDRVRLLRRWHGETELAIMSYAWEYGTTYQLTLEVDGSSVRGWVDDRLVADIVDDDTRLVDGAVALTVRDGRTATTMVSVRPVERAITRPDR